ncbi:hypothetical protein [Actinoplanes sp. G11-F43]|uniref:hypothetical protein n=1 Tax=Actinoplanes sp. G11-F43 TaxID=3424130 RepID=UPI003D34802B
MDWQERAAAGALVLLAAGGVAVGWVLMPRDPAAPDAADVAMQPYDPGDYRAALEREAGHKLTDVNFAKIEEISGMACRWDDDQFADWVAINTDDGTLNKVYVDINYRCPGREPDITAAMQRIDEARSCVMPADADPEFLALTDTKPAQAALTCAYLKSVSGQS